VLGDAGINIGGMQVARDEKKDAALVLLNLDAALPAPVAAEIAELVGAETFSVVNL